MTLPTGQAERAHAVAALEGLAIGDALGMPTQLLSGAQIREGFGRISWFREAGSDHPIAAGLPAGSVTDDTEQALLLARRLVEDRGALDQLRFAHDLLAWEDDMRARGSLDLLGPSTKAALSALQAGADPEETGRRGTTNGAAMRVTPVGIACAPEDLTLLVDRVQDSARVTHNTGIAIAGAAAIAGAVSEGIRQAGIRAGAGMTGEGSAARPAPTGSGGRDASSAPLSPPTPPDVFATCVRTACEAARIGARRGHWIAGADVAARIEWAVDAADPQDAASSLRRLSELIGTSLATQESVPAAFGFLAIFPGDPWAACCAAASAGGDTDTIAALAGAVGGSVFGRVFPADAVRLVSEVSGLELTHTAEALLALRHTQGGRRK